MNATERKGDINTRNGAAWVYFIALAVVTLFAYGRVWSFEYLHYDDTLYVTKNPHVLSGLSFANIQWAFGTLDVANWQPLTWISHMADVSVFGQSSRGPHGVNLFIHIANTLLLFWVLRRLTKAEGQSAFVAALFAVHPLHVESVAWISERKDVLSTLFGMLALCAYALYSERRNPMRYAAVVLFFAMSLMSKSMWVTFPFVLLLIDYWPLNRFASQEGNANDLRKRALRAAVEKIPLLGLTIASSVITVIAQSRVGAVASGDHSPLIYRLANAIDAYAQYLGLFLFPRGMAAFYPHPGSSISLAIVAVEAVVLLAISLAVLRMWKSRPHAFVGWAWFVGTLIPVIGLVQVGSQAYADRYAYLPTVGLSIAIVWLACDVARNLKVAPVVLTGIAVLITLVSASLTWVQSGYWRDDETLWRHAIEVTDNNYRAYANLGHALKRSGDVEGATEAVSFFVKALELYPDNPRTYVGLGMALDTLGRTAEAAKAYRKAIDVDETHANAYVNLGVLTVKAGDIDNARQLLEHGLGLDPLNAEGHNNLGAIYASQGDFSRAKAHFQEAIRLRPAYTNAKNNLARAVQMEQSQPR